MKAFKKFRTFFLSTKEGSTLTQVHKLDVPFCDVQVRAAGRYVTVLLDPHSYDEVIGDTESLDFNRYAQVLMQRIFHLQLPQHRPAKVKDVMKK